LPFWSLHWASSFPFGLPSPIDGVLFRIFYCSRPSAMLSY
jgi:hypothetical protein